MYTDTMQCYYIVRRRYHHNFVAVAIRRLPRPVRTLAPRQGVGDGESVTPGIANEKKKLLADAPPYGKLKIRRSLQVGLGTKGSGLGSRSKPERVKGSKIWNRIDDMELSTNRDGKHKVSNRSCALRIRVFNNSERPYLPIAKA
ncbi:hypothetical protein EVAR_29656_1 [Eumeta japonica]|uniref:Uncharacterized protein n=1 Tax=Eumeta variegata TaxID=151549 RepID=A0A4C1W7R4_EUMVA|nr:hypothetical protein EVAR_29656_1 [Eumeta japonica]